MTDPVINNKLSQWMNGVGPEAEVVVSSRIRLARNLQSLLFPHLMTEEQAKKTLESVENIANKVFRRLGCDSGQVGSNKMIRLEEIDTNERDILVEKHLISPMLAERVWSRGVLLNSDETVSVMINEEDHLRIQCILAGLQLRAAWDRANLVDDILDENLDIAFDETVGYLTACPTNVGTGLRASVMLHLPGLVMTKRINRVLNAIAQLGLTVRGLYGEGTEAHGNLFQVSNQITLGQSEEEIISKLEGVTQQLINQERSARSAVYKAKPWALEDRIYRAYGILTNARLIDSHEAMKLLSELRLGVYFKLFSDLDYRILTELMVLMRPAYLQKFAGRELLKADRDSLRAELFRKYLTKLQN